MSIFIDFSIPSFSDMFPQRTLPTGGQTYDEYGANVDSYVVYFQSAIDEGLNPFITKFNEAINSYAIFDLDADDFSDINNVAGALGNIQIVANNTNNINSVANNTEGINYFKNNYSSFDENYNDFIGKYPTFTANYNEANPKLDIFIANYGAIESAMSDNEYLNKVNQAKVLNLLQNIKCGLSNLIVQILHFSKYY